MKKIAISALVGLVLGVVATAVEGQTFFGVMVGVLSAIIAYIALDIIKPKVAKKKLRGTNEPRIEVKTERQEAGERILREQAQRAEDAARKRLEKAQIELDARRAAHQRNNPGSRSGPK